MFFLERSRNRVLHRHVVQNPAKATLKKVNVVAR